MSIKKEIKKYLRECKTDEEFECKLADLFSLSRNQFFEASSLVKEYPHSYLACMTCSCGSRSDSCAEDGDGNYSRFFVDRKANIFRVVEIK